MPARADQEYLRILELAALTGEEMVAAVLHQLFENGCELSAEKAAARLPKQRISLIEPVRLLMPVRVQLSDYDRLLGSRFEEAGQ